MLKQVIGKNIKELDANEFTANLSRFVHVMIDLGTGDGKFAYNYARNNPAAFVIGIDASAESMEETSYKASRKPAKGGLDNLVLLWASAEQLPAELTGLANEIYINFPWGSLLAGVVKAEPVVMENIAKVIHPLGKIHIFISYDAKYEPQIMEQLDLPELSLTYFNNMRPRYNKFGIGVDGVTQLTDEQKRQLTSSWPKKILSQRQRDIYYVTAHVISESDYEYRHPIPDPTMYLE